MPPRRSTRQGRGQRRGYGRNVRREDRASRQEGVQGENQNVGLGENQEVNMGENQNVGGGTNVNDPNVLNPIARDVVAALAAANLLHPPLVQTTESDRAIYAMREFRRLNPPQFNGEGGDFLAANHWLADIRKLFNALKITEDDLRVSIVACQLVGEANEWWESVLAARRDARRAAREAARANEPDVENLTWAEFEELFESQYFPESYREQLRDQFERLEQGNMTVSEYVAKFQALSRYAPELVATEDRKCRRFEKGLHSSVKRLVVSQHKMKFSEIIECARSVELPRDAPKNTKVWEPRNTPAGIGTSLGSYGSQGRKRPREPSQVSQNRANFRQTTPSATKGVSTRAPIVCHRCHQPGHVRTQCPIPPRNCYTCGREDHIAKNCPAGSKARSESGSVQQPRYGHGNQQFGGVQKQQQTQFRPATSGHGSRVERGASSSTPIQGTEHMRDDAQGQGTQARVYNVMSAVTTPTSQAPETSVVRGTKQG